MRLLIAEDHPMDQALMRAYVDSLGWRAAMVQDAASALAYAAAEDFDRLVIDQNLPDGFGLDVLREVRKGAQNAHTPALIWTAYEIWPLLRPARELYNVSVTAKPLACVDLERWVNGEDFGSAIAPGYSGRRR